MAISHAFTNQISDGTNTNIVRPSDWNSAHNQYYTLSGNTLGASTVSGTNVVLQGSGNVSLSGTGQSIVIYATGGVGGGAALSAGTQSVSSGTVNFANSNGISFGMSGSNQITASYTVPTVPTSYVSNVNGSSGAVTVAGTGTSATNASITLNSAGLAISVAVPGAGGGVAVGASTQTATSGTVEFINSNGISFGMSGSSQITASYTTSPVSNVTAGNNISLSTAGSTLTINAQAVALAGGTQTATSGTVNFVNSNNITFGMSNSSQITASFSESVQTQASGNIAGIGFTSTTTTGSLITASLGTNGLSMAVPLYLTNAAGGSSWTVSDNATSGTVGRLAFTNLNGVTLSLSTGAAGSHTIVGSHNGLTSQSNQAFSASGGSSAFQTLNFANSNGVTFSNSNGSVIASYTVPTVPTAYVSSLNGNSGALSLAVGSSLSSSVVGSTTTIGLASNISTYLQTVGNYLTTARASNDAIGLNTAQTNVTWTVNSSGLSLNASGYAGTGTSATNASITLNSNGLAISVAPPGAGGGNNIAVTQAGGGTTAAPGTVQFATGNGFTFGFDAASSQITLTATLLTVSDGVLSTGLRRLAFSNSNGISFGLSTNAQSVTLTASHNGLTNFNVSASTTSNNLSNLVFSNSNNVSFGLNGSTITASAAGGGGAMYANISGNVAGNTTASGSTLNFSGINVTLSGTNDSQIAISAPAVSSLVGVNGISIATTGSTISVSNVQYTLSGYNHYNDAVLVAGTVGQGTLNFDPINLANPVQMDRIGKYLYNTNPTNSSGSHTVSVWVGIYTRSLSSLSLFQSTSTSLGISQSGTVGSYASFSALRLMTIPFTTTLSAADYWLGVVSSTSSAGSNGTYSQMLQSNINTNFAGMWNAATNRSVQATLGQGLYSAATAGLPGSVAFSQIDGTASNGFRPPVVMFISGTI